jgi:choline dehydrogenase-like flavoprotein
MIGMSSQNHRYDIVIVGGGTAGCVLAALYRIDSEIHCATATSEEVLTAGAIGSAQLLLCSGIGPESDLRQAHVEIVHALPGVGRNLHDHPRVNLVYRSRHLVPAARNNHGEIIGLLRSTPQADGPHRVCRFRGPGVAVGVGVGVGGACGAAWPRADGVGFRQIDS